MAEWAERLENLFSDPKEQGDMMAAVTMLDDNRRNMLWAMRDDEALKQALCKIAAAQVTTTPFVASSLVPTATAAAAAPGLPRLYNNIILSIGGGNNKAELVRLYSRISHIDLQKVLDMHGCDIVQDPVTKAWVSFDAIELRDNMVLLALQYSTPIDARVLTLESFIESSANGFEADATAAMYQKLKQQHSNVKVLPVREIRSADGRKQEVDGAVVADGCAAILKAKQVLDDTDVTQLASCIKFIRDSALIGPATELKGKKILGFLASRTLISDPGKVEVLVQDCHERGYGILVSSGRSPGLCNSRVRRLPVECAMRKRAYGAYNCPVRVVL